MSHPVLQATAAMTAALKSVRDVNPTFLRTDQKAAALVELGRVEARLAELRLRLLADAGDVAATTGAHDAASWLAHHTHLRHEDARADLALAEALDRRYPTLAFAFAEGAANQPQARVIARCLDDLPAETGPEVRDAAEAHLVGLCDTFGPRDLGRLGRRILEVVAPEVAEAAEAKRLAHLESEARRQTRLTLRRQGDGTTRLSGLIPDAAATRLATYLEAFTSPRQSHLHDQARPEPTDARADPVQRTAYPRRLGKAFIRLLEAVDPKRLPDHGGDATTILVTVSLEQLRTELAAGTLLDADRVPGDSPTADRLSAGEIRRLACNAHLIPVVLGGQSEILDIGRGGRLHTPTMRKAMRLRDRGCLVEGCTVPAAWCEAHHFDPWHRGGKTNLDDGGLLCTHHHHLVHDPRHRAERLPGGRIRLHLRT